MTTPIDADGDPYLTSAAARLSWNVASSGRSIGHTWPDANIRTSRMDWPLQPRLIGRVVAGRCAKTPLGSPACPDMVRRDVRSNAFSIPEVGRVVTEAVSAGRHTRPMRVPAETFVAVQHPGRRLRTTMSAVRRPIIPNGASHRHAMATTCPPGTSHARRRLAGYNWTRLPSRCRAITMRCISLVPSPISPILASRIMRSTG